jgi:Ca2+-binding EF-hand superfamily protein
MKDACEPPIAPYAPLLACLLTLVWTAAAPAEEQKNLEEPAKKAKGANTQGPVPPRELFERLDVNNDQTITRDEIPEEAIGAFETFLRYGDSNSDGKLQGNEFRDLLEKHGPSLAGAALVPRFAQADKDKDGKISKTEFSGAPAMFSRLDADEDGFITRDEIQKFGSPGQPAQVTKSDDSEASAAMENEGSSKTKTKTDKPVGQPKTETSKVQQGAVMIKRRFAMLDKNSDGKLSADELPGGAKRLKRLDSDENGSVSLEEFTQALFERK